MPVTFILGRAGTGKTRYCLDALAAELDQPDQSRKLIFIVPEQASFQMERALALRAATQGYWRAEVLSFTRLAFRLFGEGGGSVEVLDAHARTMALRRLASTEHGALEPFGSAAGTNGLFVELDRLIEELLLEGVTPEALTEAAQRLEPGVLRRKVAAVARLFAAYLAWLGRERIDPGQRLAVLREQLEHASWLKDASVWVDGFSGFTGQELATLVTLGRLARDLTLTLLVDPQSPAVLRPGRGPDALDLFYRTETTYQRLHAAFGDAGVEVRPPVRLRPGAAPRFVRVPQVAQLEARLALPFGSGEPPPPPSDDAQARPAVRVVACATHREELRQAAGFIRRMVIESGGELRFRDFALIARDLEPFAELVADVFDEYEIPYFLDRRRSMAAHALSRFVQALFEALTKDFPVSALVRLLGSGLLPLSRAQAEQLQDTVVEHQVRGVAAWRRRSWDFERHGRNRWPRGHERGAPGNPPKELDAARRGLCHALEPLVELASAPRPAAGAEWAQRLHAAVEALGIRTRLESWIAAARRQRAWETAELHRLAWEAFTSILENLHDVLAETPLRIGEVSAIVGAALREATLGLAPPTLDQVLVGAIERTRHPEIKYAWVFAFNEGVFPAPPPEDHLLSAAEREALARAAGWHGHAGSAATSADPPAASGEPVCPWHPLGSRRDEVFAERLLAYIAFTRPSQGLTISYAQTDEHGEARFPSPLLDEVKRALPELRVEQARDCPPPSCLAELARAYLAARADEAAGGRALARCAKLCAELRAGDRHGPALGRLLRGTTYRNECAPVGNYRGAADETRVVWSCSPSEVETYLQCPFRHFAEYGLRLDAQRGPAPLALELGSAAHQVLAAVTRRAIAARDSVRDLSDEQWTAFLRAALEEFQRSQPDDLAQRQPRRAFLTGVLAGFLQEVVLAHAERWRRGRFEPLACEQAFDPAGGPGVLPALELEGADGRLVRLRGQIDRVDRCRSDARTYLLAYDYKSSAATVSGDYLTQDRLQLFIYLLALGQAFRQEADLRLAGVFLAPLYPDLAVLNNKYAAQADERDQRLYMYRPRGLFDARAAPLLDERLGAQVSPVAHMQLKKKGGFYAKSDAKPAEEIRRRLELARRTILHAAAGVAVGRIEIAPLVEKKRLACNFCGFRAVCRFDRTFNQPRAAEHALPLLADAEHPPGAPRCG